MPAKRSGSCSLKQLPDITMGNTNVKTVSLFEQKRLRGYWPVYDEKDGQRQLTVGDTTPVHVGIICIHVVWWPSG